MKRQSYDNLEQETEKKLKRREKKKRPKMRVSGAGVKKLQDIIRKKG